MFGWISRSALPEPSTIDWLFDVYAWLLAETGGYDAFRKRQRLVVPNDEFFPVSSDLEGHELAQRMFDLTRTHAGLSHLTCNLVPHEEDPDTRDVLGAGVAFQAQSHGAAGTFLHGAGVEQAQISYAPSKAGDPEAFVATMAHELGHFLMHGFRSPVPGGEEAREPATDVCAVFLGFGVFTANSAFRFQQYNDGLMQGWRYSRLGYLGERPLSYALAIFLALQGAKVAAARQFLRANVLSDTKNALLHLEKERAADLARLMT